MKNENGKWIPETPEEQTMYDTIYNKGFAQAKKNEPAPTVPPVVEEPKTNSNIDVTAIQDIIKASMGEIIKPLQEQFSSLQSMSKQNLVEKVVNRQKTKLPEVYLSQLEGNTEAELKASYDTLTTKFQEDLKAIGLSTNFGSETPTSTPGGTTITDKPTVSFKAMSPQEKIELYKKDPKLYSKLSDEN